MGHGPISALRLQRPVRPQADDPGVLPLARHPAQQDRFVAERLGRLRVEAEFQRYRMRHVRIACLPHLAEAAHAEKLLQFPIADAWRMVADLEPREPRGKDGV